VNNKEVSFTKANIKMIQAHLILGTDMHGPFAFQVAQKNMKITKAYHA
jgi:hypothetical protein